MDDAFLVGRTDSSQVPGRFSCAAWMASAAVRTMLFRPAAQIRQDARQRRGGLAGGFSDGGGSPTGADAAASMTVGVAPAIPRSPAAATSVPATRTRGGGTVRLRPSSSAASIRLSSWCGRAMLTAIADTRRSPKA